MACSSLKKIERDLLALPLKKLIQESCEKWKKEENRIEVENSESGKLKDAHDASRSKRGGGYNLLTGRRTIVLLKLTQENVLILLPKQSL